MMDSTLVTKWDREALAYDLITWAEDRRFAPAKRRLFSRMAGRCLMMAAGTGNDFRFFPPGLDITAIDVSPRMIERARRKAADYGGSLEILLMDAQNLQFADASFDTVVTSCTLCSVPDPIRGLREIYRCLKPGGRLLMFEHVRSRFGPVAVFQDLMTAVTRLIGPDMNRDTVGNVQRAGFNVLRERNAYFDVVKAIGAEKPSAGANGSCL